ncbi:putative peptidase [Enhygromyxa salina]|uniref:Putative peptidase n=1 Tax=Enhygromyxa salina TaxID=215803 RepID=A0A2S9XHW8_9BACT|nr:putative peptidase [Enhygromyxa salina]
MLALALAGCPRPASPPGEDGQPSAEAGGESGGKGSAEGSRASDNGPDSSDPFAGLEPLRPHPWAGWPVENVDIEGYDGWRISPVTGGFERDRGLVFNTDPGAFVLAIADAQVVEIGRNDQDQLELTLDHGQGIESHLGPLSDALVHAGLPVTRGAVVGLAAGRSLRLRVSVDGLDIDPLLALRQPLHRWPALLRVLPTPPPE